MALDPATAKLIAKVVISQITDEEKRQRLIIGIIIAIVVFTFIIMIPLFALTSTIDKIKSFFGFGDDGQATDSSYTGIDLAGAWHSNITTVEKGTIVFAGVQQGYGNCVEIKHSTENGTIYYTFYAHLARIDVIEGQEIQQGTVVGIQGGDPNRDPNPGYSTGSHLHFEIRKSQKGDFINPREYLFGNKEV